MNLSKVTTSTAERKKLRRNLRLWVKRATNQEILDGLTWYNEAMAYTQALSTTFGVSREIAAGVISALSPNNRWERNKRDAMKVLQAVKDGMPEDSVSVCTFDRNKSKAFEIARGNRKVLRQSPKTFAFARNVGERDENHVTIDRWHLRACQSVSMKPIKLAESCSAKQYRIIEEETMKVAREHGMTGYALQAVIWVTIRNRWNN